MVHRAVEAAARLDAGVVEVVDLRTIAPWDTETVVRSVARTGRCLVLHEDTLTAGFGAEIAATVTKEAFLHLEAPVERVAPPDCPLAYEQGLLDAALPRVDLIAARLAALVEY
jgi:2-oxoisovalerate dehydrogenase E1 component